MKKRVLAIMLACLMLVSLLPVGALAEEVEQVVPECKGDKHYKDANCTDYTEIEKINEGCGKYTYTVYQCNVCEDFFAADFVKNESDHVWGEGTAATCTENGTRKCTVCGELDKAQGHTRPEASEDDETAEPEVIGNCKDGWYYVDYVCTVCGEEVKGEKAEAAGHKYGAPEIIKEPTLTDNGLAIYTCTVCGEKTEPIPVLAHVCSKKLEPVAEVPAKCGVPGVKAHDKCTVCGKLYLNGKEVTADKLVIKAEEHDKLGAPVLKEKVVSAASGSFVTWKCTEAGEYTFSTNTEYGVNVYKVVDGERSWFASVAPDGTTLEMEANVEYQFNYWYGPFEVFEETTPENFAGDCDNKSVTWYGCSKCGVTYSVEGEENHNWVEHKGVDPTCDSYGYTSYFCLDCGEWKTEQHDPLTHNKGLTGNALKAQFIKTVEVTCTEDGYDLYMCVTCKREYKTNIVDALGHDEETVTVAATCVTYGYTFTYCANECCDEYVVVTSKDGYKTMIEDEDGEEIGVRLIELVVNEEAGYNKEEHEHVILVHKPVNSNACTDAGNYVYYCDRCNVYYVEYHEATGHEYPVDKNGNKVGVTYAPTCLEAGYTKYSCVNCDYYEITDVVAPITDTMTEMLKRDGYTMEEALEVHKHLDLTKAPITYREGTCEIIGLQLYWCLDCSMYILIEETNTGCHMPAPEDLEKLTGTFYTVAQIETINKLVGNYTVVDDYMGYTASISFVFTDDLANGKVVVDDKYGMLSFFSFAEYKWISVEGIYDYTIDFEGNLNIKKAAFGISYDEENECVLYNEWTELTRVDNRADLEIKEFAAQAASCEKAGWTAQYYCDRCDELVEAEPVDALEHTKINVVEAKKPTCTEDGRTEGYTCTTCKVVVTSRPIDATGHNEVLLDSGVKADTFTWSYNKDGELVLNIVTTFGYDHYGCTECDYEYITNYEPLDCYHEWELDEYSSTCEYLAYRCAKCDPEAKKLQLVDDKADLIPHMNAAGEILVDECTNNVKDRVCVMGCTEHKKDENGLYVYDEEGEPVMIAATIGQTHTALTAGIHYEPTCKDAGYTISFCTACGEYVVEEDKNGVYGDHVWTDWVLVAATETELPFETRKCTVCGIEETRDVENPELLDVIGYYVSLDNAIVSGADITETGLIAVTISLNAYEKNIWGFNFTVNYDPAALQYVRSEFVSANFNTGFAHDKTVSEVVGVGEDAVTVVKSTGHVNVAANAAANVEVTGSEDVVVLYFKVLATGETEGEITVSAITTLDAESNKIDSKAYSAAYETVQFMDLTDDGEVALLDDVLALYNLLLAGEYAAAADIDMDGEITLADMLTMYEVLIGALEYEDIVNP